MPQEGETVGVVFVADDLGAWLVGLLADAALRRLTTWVLGSDQERALRQAANAAFQQTLDQFSPAGDEQARQLTTAIREAFKKPEMAAPQTGQMTLLEALQASIAAQLAVLDTSLTGTGQPAADVRGVSGAELADSLTGHLMREIVLRGSRGGPLAPLADQLNHDLTHLQGQRVESKLDWLLNEVRDALARAGGGPEAPRKPVRLLPRPVFLAGREELLAEMGTRLSAEDDPEPRLVALCGLGGAGKTSAAVEYAYRHLAEVGVAWQLAAEDATVLAAGFGELAAQLGARGLADRRDPVASVHAVLARFPAPWLLLFDNAKDLAAVAAFLPPAGPGQVLITSQNPDWPGKAMHVQVLDPDVAAGFLISRTGDPDRTAARDLAGVLGGLPLALEQAAAYTQATGMTLAGYLSVFRGRAADLLARGPAAGHPMTVAATLGLALSRLGDEAPPAAGLLQLLACLAPEPVPLALLLSDAQVAGELAPGVAATAGPLLDDRVAAGDAIAALRRYSLVTPAGDGLVLVHRLVQAITVAPVSADVAGQWKQAAAALVEAAVPADTTVPAAWPVCAVLLPHAQAALADDSDGMARIANYLGSSGSYIAARDLWRRVLDAREQVLGPEHEETLFTRHQLARWTGEAGDPAGARDLFAGLLPVFERVLGPEHPRTLAARHQLARWTGHAGDPAGARDLFAGLVPVFERVLGPEHPRTLGPRYHVALWTGEAGDPAGGRDLLAALLPVRERVQGPEHEETLFTRHQLARWTGEAGDPAGARDLFAGLLPVFERVLGPEHPRTLAARHQLARWTGHAGDPAGARDLFAGLVPVFERVFGPEHPRTLGPRYHVALWTGEAGDPAGGRDLLAALLPVRERVQGPEHEETLFTRHQLARWTGEAGDPAGARDLFAGLLPVFERVLGPEHPRTLAVRHQLARWTGHAGDPAGARDLFAGLVPVFERVFGPEHPRTLGPRYHVALWTGEAGDPAGGRDLLAALLPVRERVQGPEHEETLFTRHQLARWTGEAGDPAGARDLFAGLLPVFERVLGTEHPDTLAARHQLARWTGHAGDPAGARDLFAGLLPVFERVLGPEHPRTLAARQQLARWTGEAERDLGPGVK